MRVGPLCLFISVQVVAPLLGDVGGVYSSWTPLAAARNVHRLYGGTASKHKAAADGAGSAQISCRLDESDPWQFVNFRINAQPGGTSELASIVDV